MVNKEKTKNAQRIKFDKFLEYEKQGLSYNFGHYDWELLFVYDYEKRRRVVSFPHISHCAKHLYVILKSYLIEQKDFCFPDQKSLADLMGCSISSVVKYLKELETFDLITILKFKYGSQNKNIYLINRVDKVNTIKEVLSFKKNQGYDLKPQVVKPKITIDEIIDFLKERTGNSYRFIDKKRKRNAKPAQRDNNGRFINGDSANRMVDNVVDKSKNIVDKSKNIVDNLYKQSIAIKEIHRYATVNNGAVPQYNLPNNNT